MAELAPSRHATRLPSGGRRGVVWGIALLAAAHSFLVMLWMMPVNPIRDVVGQQHLTSYINNGVLPFEQSWRIFAPVPRRGGENVVVRAFLGDPRSGEGKVTSWFDITADEDERITYLVNPSRIHSATRRLGSNINETMPKLSARQQLLTRADHAESTPAQLENQLAKRDPTPSGRGDAAAFVESDEILTRFLTLYATARWGHDVTAIQYKVGHRSVPDYSKRNEIHFRDVPFTYYTFGFRAAMRSPGDAQQAFDGYVSDAPPGDVDPATIDSKGKVTVGKGSGSP